MKAAQTSLPAQKQKGSWGKKVTASFCKTDDSSTEKTEMQPKHRIYMSTEDHVTQKPLAVLSRVKKQFKCGILCNLRYTTEAFLISALRKTEKPNSNSTQQYCHPCPRAKAT